MDNLTLQSAVLGCRRSSEGLLLLYKLPSRLVVLVETVPTMTVEGHHRKAGRQFLEQTALHRAGLPDLFRPADLFDIHPSLWYMRMRAMLDI
jgi:hypothetical protein